MSSDHSSPPRSSTRGTTERRAALNAKKDATTLTKKRATFLGAEDDDDDTPFDFDQYDKKQRPSSNRTREKSPTVGDGILGGAFDDLFNLGDGTGTGTGDGLDDALQGDLDADAAPVKKRKIVARMDETRLLGPTGFPRLVGDIKKIKIKGKGHEVCLKTFLRSRNRFRKLTKLRYSLSALYRPPYALALLRRKI